MRSHSKHIRFTALADLAERRTSDDERAAHAAHLASCAACASELERLERTLDLMRTDTAVDAPRDALAYAINIFDERKQSSGRSVVRRIVAALSFDSSSNFAPAFGVRSGQPATRQMIFSAEQTDIDLRISSTDDRWTVAGQVLGGECAGGRVQIDGTGISETVVLNEQCEFTLPPVASGNYSLRLLLANSEVEIPQLRLGA